MINDETDQAVGSTENQDIQTFPRLRNALNELVLVLRAAWTIVWIPLIVVLLGICVSVLGWLKSLTIIACLPAVVWIGIEIRGSLSKIFKLIGIGVGYILFCLRSCEPRSKLQLALVVFALLVGNAIISAIISREIEIRTGVANPVPDFGLLFPSQARKAREAALRERMSPSNGSGIKGLAEWRRRHPILYTWALKWDEDGGLDEIRLTNLSQNPMTDLRLTVKVTAPDGRSWEDAYVQPSLAPGQTHTWPAWVTLREPRQSLKATAQLTFDPMK